MILSPQNFVQLTKSLRGSPYVLGQGLQYPPVADRGRSDSTLSLSIAGAPGIESLALQPQGPDLGAYQRCRILDPTLGRILDPRDHSSHGKKISRWLIYNIRFKKHWFQVSSLRKGSPLAQGKRGGKRNRLKASLPAPESPVPSASQPASITMRPKPQEGYKSVLQVIKQLVSSSVLINTYWILTMP